MKRWITSLLVLGLLAGAMTMPAEAKKKKKKKPTKVTRVEEAQYQTPALGHMDVVGGCNPGGQDGLGCVTLHPSATESYLTLEIADATGTTTYGVIGQGQDDQGFTNTIANVCGKTSESIPIERGVEIIVFINALPSSSGCNGFGTTGTVTATFSNLP